MLIFFQEINCFDLFLEPIGLRILINLFPMHSLVNYISFRNHFFKETKAFV